MKKIDKNTTEQSINIFKALYIGTYEDTVMGSELYQNALESSKLLNKPIFSFQGVHSLFDDLTYRKLNDWDSKGLLDCNRTENEKGWRKFSIKDVIRLKILQDLKTYGFSNDKITKALEDIFEEENSDFKHCFFEYFFCLHFTKCEKIILAVQNDGSSLLISELNLMKMLGANLNENKPVLILPFYAYLASISNIILNQTISLDIRSTALGLINAPVEEKFKMILEIIKNEEYEEILIQKKDKNYIIKSKRKNSKFSKDEIIQLLEERKFQNIEIKERNGEIIALSVTDIKKI